MVQVKIVLENGVEMPFYATKGSAGMDLRANIKEPLIFFPGTVLCIPTGTRIQLPEGFEMQIRPRSGLALKNGITVLNTPATIDSDYTGEVKVILINHSNQEYSIKPQERIAQMVLNKVEKCEFEQVEELEETERTGGFGSTGKL